MERTARAGRGPRATSSGRARLGGEDLSTDSGHRRTVHDYTGDRAPMQDLLRKVGYLRTG